MFFNWRKNKTQSNGSYGSSGDNGALAHVMATKPAIDLAIPTKTETATFALG